MIGIGIIGYGYWGPNLVRNFAENSSAKVVGVSDLREERLRLASSRYPGITVTPFPQELIEDPRIDAIAIATPVSSHHDLAMEALRAGKHVLLEKPLAASSDQASRLIDEALRRHLVLMVDHTFVYTGAVRKIRELVNQGEVGDIYYYDSVRINLGLFQHDVNVIWDLAVHDLAIMDYVLPLRPKAVSATGMSHIPGSPENIAYMTLFFDGNFIGHIHVNWLAPVKLRNTLIGGSRKMILYNDLEPSEKIKIYDKGVMVSNNKESIYQMLIGYRAGDMWAPRLDHTEALRLEVAHFLECVEGGKQPVTDGEAGLRVVKILESATESMKAAGRLVLL